MRFYIIFFKILLIYSISSSQSQPPSPQFENIQPVWEEYLIDNFSQNPVKSFKVITFIKEGYLYICAETDTTYEASELNWDPDGVIIKSIDLKSGMTRWKQQLRAPYNVKDFVSYSRMDYSDTDNELNLFGFQYVSGRINTPWVVGLDNEKYHLSTMRIDPISGEIVERLVGSDTLGDFNARFYHNHLLDTKKRLFMRPVFKDGHSLSLEFLQWSEDLSIDSSKIFTYDYAIEKPEEYKIGGTYVNLKNGQYSDGIWPIKTTLYSVDENFVFQDHAYFHLLLDVRDLENIKIRNEITMESLKPSHPIRALSGSAINITESYVTCTSAYYENGNTWFWISWFDHEGNFLGSNDRLNVDGHKLGYIGRSPQLDDKLISYNHTTDKDNEANFFSISPDEEPKLLRILRCNNCSIKRNSRMMYDKFNHQIIYTCILNDSYNYIAAFDANEFGLSRPNLTNEVNYEDLIMYPIPTSDYITLETTSDVTSISYKIMTIDGKLVLEDFTSSIDKNKYRIDVQNIKSGNYLLFINSDTTQYKPRVISIVK